MSEQRTPKTSSGGVNIGILKGWKKCFWELLNREIRTDLNGKRYHTAESKLQSLSEDDMKEVINSLKSYRAPGSDSITA